MVTSVRPGVAEPQPPAQTWSDRWREARNRLLASARFRRWAAAFPLTRPVARARANEVFDLVAGFVYSQVLAAALQLRLFDHLAAGPAETATLARAMALPEPAAERLLAACAALSLTELRSGGRWGLGPRGAALVGEPGLAALVAHHEALYRDLADPVGLLRQGGRTHLSAYWPYAERHGAQAGGAAPLADADVARYSELMTASQPMVAEQVLDAVRLRGHRCLLDVGGGEGAFVQAVAARVPALDLMLLDLPAVAARARSRLAGLGLARVQVHGGDFQRQPLPRGADVVSLVRIVHDHDDEVVAALLRAVHAALPPGGRLLLAEPMAGTPGARGMGDAYFGFYLLAMRSGRPRTPQRLADLLHGAGFGAVRRVPTRQPLLAGVIEASVKQG
jgi:demethylspheroidene O-methyltransferase